MTEEVTQSSEGFSTLAAQFTRKSVDRILVVVKSLRREGWTDKKILAKMQEDLRSYPRHAVRRLYDVASGKEVPDDVTPSNLVSQTETKKNTRSLAVKVPIPGIEKDGLLQHEGALWLVLSAEGKTYLVKKLV